MFPQSNLSVIQWFLLNQIITHADYVGRRG